MASPIVKTFAAAVLYGSVVAVTLLPHGVEARVLVGLAALTLAALGLAAIGGVRKNLRLEQAKRAVLRANMVARWESFVEISRLEELHLLPASEPDRSTHTHTSERS